MPPANNPDPRSVQPGQGIVTACGGRSNFAPGMPWAYYKGKAVYFCLLACKKDFERDPHSSCLNLTATDF